MADTEGQFLPRLLDDGVLAVPGLLIVFYAFQSGGFFADVPALGSIGLAGLIIVRAVLAEDPFAGLTKRSLAVAGAFTFYIAWVLLSATWSHSFSRALVDADRDLSYLLAFVLGGSLPRTAERLRWMVRGVAAAMVLVLTAAFLTRVAPDLFPTNGGLDDARLIYPLGYSNALGLSAALAAIFCVHLSSTASEQRAVRLAAAGALPIVGCVLYFTLSRGAILIGVAGLVVYTLLAGRRSVMATLLAAGPPAILAVAASYNASLLTGSDPTSPSAATQGHRLFLGVVICCVLAVAARELVARRWSDGQPVPKARPYLKFIVAGVAMLAIAGAFVLHAPTHIAHGVSATMATPEANVSGNTRNRLALETTNGRVQEWRVALDDFADEPVHGSGAGTFGVIWTRRRPAGLAGLVVQDGHSLYGESLAELGLLGFAAVLTILALLAIGFWRLPRGEGRAVRAVLLAAGATWAVHAGIDWDWEMPAVTCWVFALGGFALARPPRESTAREPRAAIRLAVTAVLAGLLFWPVHIMFSERALNDAAAAYERGDCAKASTSARSSRRWLSSRPEPYEVIAYCDLLDNNPARAATSLQAAIKRDPRVWEYWYALAIARTAEGASGIHEARHALYLFPRGGKARDLVNQMDTQPATGPVSLRLDRRLELSARR